MNSKQLLKRLSLSAFTILAVTTFTFVIIKLLPGGIDAFLRSTVAGQGDSAGDVTNFDGPINPNGTILEQYLSYMSGALQGDFGISLYYQEPVGNVLISAIPWTVFVLASALILTFAIGILLGAALAYNEGGKFDIYISTLSTFLNSVPYYIAAVILVFVLGHQWELFPTSGRYNIDATVGLNIPFISSAIHHAALPIASIVLTGFGFRALAMRGNSIQVLGQDYVRVARLRGLSQRRIITEYVGRNAVLPMYTGFLIAIGFMFGGSVVLERIFQYKGVGFYLFRAISARDYPLMMGSFILITVAVVLGLLIADLTYGFIDPRANTDENEGSDMTVGQYLSQLLEHARHSPTAIKSAVSNKNNNDRYNTADSIEVISDASAKQLLQATSDTEVSRQDRIRQIWAEWVIAPYRIIKEDPRARIGTVIVLFYLLMGTVAPLLVSEPKPNQGPVMVQWFQNMQYPLGTTAAGQSILSLIVYSTPPMFKMIISGGVFATGIATVIGLVAGYSAGGLSDKVLMTISDIAMTIPGLPLIMVLATVIEPTDPYLVGILLTINAWGGIARQVRSQVLSIRRESYIEASRVLSLRKHTILTKDILPNVMPYIFIKFVESARRVIFSSVALYFLGVLPFKTLNWGVIINLGYRNGALYSWSTAYWLISPIIVIISLTYGLILLAQGTDQLFNPRVRARHVEETKQESLDTEVNTPTNSVVDDD